MAEFLNLLAEGSNILVAVITALVTWAGSFLFYRQKRDSMDIENESKQSDEWRKLYLESQEDSRKKDEKIDELRKEMQTLRTQLIQLERRVQLNSIYRCDKAPACHLRVQNIKEEDEPSSELDQ